MQAIDEPRRSGGWKLLALVVGLVSLGVLGVVFRLDRELATLAERFRGAGTVGVLGFVGTYVAATVLSLPGSLLTIAAGALYGPWLGIAVVSPASVLGATAAFLLGRTLARRWIAERMAANPRLAAIDAAIGRRPFVLVLLLRLSPVFPFNALNYGLGLTGVGLVPYVVGSAIGMLPGTFLYVYIGSIAGDAAAVAAGGTAMPPAGSIALAVVGLVATLAVVVLVTRVARRELQRALPAPEAHPDAPTSPPLPEALT